MVLVKVILKTINSPKSDLVMLIGEVNGMLSYDDIYQVWLWRIFLATLLITKSEGNI